MIEVRDLCKTYRVHQRPEGLAAALRSLVHRRYDEVHAVSDLCFRIADGERVGFLGPNGAGKTTTLKMLSGLLHPTRGTLAVDGFTPQRRDEAFLKRVTLVMGQKQQLLWDLPPVETFALNRAVYGIPRAEFDRTLTELTDLLQAGGLVGKPARQLSLGERMKCELIAALLHQPRVLFLDEPTIGLDVSMQATVRGFIRAYNERTGATVLLTSHYMEDVAALCPRVIVIDKGRLLYDGELRALVQRVRPFKRLSIRFAEPPAPEVLARVGEVLSLEGLAAQVRVRGTDVKDAVRDLLGTLAVADLTVEDPPLDEVMRDLFDGNTAARGAA
ncbi:MAG: ATP-binding cassette domain-containing protein [Deltaproteobacteria bacterium]|nr:ATP-binding cassette domain-containing protein [Deltaproteobacteria bacterium]